MQPYQTFLTSAIFCLAATSWLSARTIMLDDPRPGIVRTEAYIVFDVFANGKQVGQFVNEPTVTKRNGVLSVTTEEVTFTGWEIETASSSSASSFDLNGSTYTLTIDSSAWMSHLLDSFSSRIEGGEQKALLTPPTLGDFHVQPFEGSITLTGDRGEQSLDFAVGFDQGQFIGGRHVTPDSDIHVYSMAIIAKRETPYSFNVDGTQINFQLSSQLSIDIAPEPGGGIIKILFFCLATQTGAARSRCVRPAAQVINGR